LEFQSKVPAPELSDQNLSPEHYLRLLSILSLRVWNYKEPGQKYRDGKIDELRRDRNRLKRQLQAELDSLEFVQKLSSDKLSFTQEKLDQAVFLLKSVTDEEKLSAETQRQILQFLRDVNDY
jgi:hypothetical protein